MQTKILIGLCLAQLALIVLVYGELAELGERAEAPPPPVPGPPAEAAPAGMVNAGTQPGATAEPDDERLRQIIREELTAILHGRAAASPEQAQIPPDNRTVDPVEQELRRQQVSARLQYHASVGNISAADMQELQLQIAELGEPARTEMLRELVKALNAGQLEGRL